MNNDTKKIEELVRKSRQNPKIIYTYKGFVINNGTPFKVKQPFYFLVKIMTSIANLITKVSKK